MFTPKKIFELVSVCTAFASGMLLYYGSLGIPWAMQSYKGQTPAELAIKRRQRIMVWFGIPCAIIALVTQLVLILYY
jgi:hypothetical protein